MDRGGLRRVRRRPAADGQDAGRMVVRRPRGRLQERRAGARRDLRRPPNTSHQTLEPRTAMAYWQNGKLYMHAGTQSTVQTVPSIARWLRIEPADIVLDQRVHRRRLRQQGDRHDQSCIIPALLSKKANAPVMMRITPRRGALHRRRPSRGARPRQGRLRQGRPDHRARHVRRRRERAVRAGRRRRAGRADRVAAVPAAGDALARHCAVLTNTPPRRAQSQPGGMQGITLVEPILAKAARKLGIDQVAIRRDQRSGRQGAGSARRTRAGSGPTRPARS